ncbi:hypothetical protein CC86DRAFT_339918 [Ophiobolus disseminans]|uniref:Uncharacterized protein n=1 Tax=Ophiobolus disseminans TaxID=1469910 RepID=A0A6A7AH17_9PLEO|nr:hypothetical protein CC86DRAFT_339918 [Ophiobolus disseminans]
MSPKNEYPSSAPSSPQHSRSASYEFNRRAPTGFGSRLADARNLRPDEAPFAPPPRTVSPVIGEDAGPALPPLGQLPFTGSESVCKVVPKYGGVKGSYISPYDSGGQVPGNPYLAFSSTTVEEFEAKYGTAARLALAAKEDAQGEDRVEGNDAASSVQDRSISFGSFLPTTMPEKSASHTAKKEEVPQVPEGAHDRALFLGPFKLIRKECAAKKESVAGMRELDAWLSRYMHEGLHEVIACDEMLPSVVYTIKIKMTNQHWFNYNQALAHFTAARDLHNLLSQGQEGLDHVTRVHKNDGMEELTWPQLTVPELSMDEMLAMLVKQHRLGVPWDFARMTSHPELVPEELGGKMKDYPLYGRKA